MRASWIAVVAGLIACGSPYDSPLEQLDRMDGPTFVEIGEVRALDDGRVIFCSGVDGMNVVDASSPSNLVRVEALASGTGSAAFPRCQHVAFDADYIYMSNRSDEVQPLPFIAAFDRDTLVEGPRFLPQGGSVEGIAAANGYVYAARHEAGLTILERGTQLVELGVTAEGELTNAWGVAVRGTTAYVADGVGGLVTIDVSDPAAPTVIARLALVGAATSVELDSAGTVAFLAMGRAGVAVVDVSDPASPALLAMADTPGSAVQVALDGDHAFVADWNDVRVFDVSNPAAPTLVGSRRIDADGSFSRVLGVAARDGVAYAGEWTGLYSFRLHAERKAPDLWIAHRELDFGKVAPGARDAIAVVVENHGREPLRIHSMEVPALLGPSTAFSLDRHSMTIPPGGADFFELTFRSRGDSPVEANLFIRSDDPDDSVRVIGLRANTAGVGVGDPAPPVNVELLDGSEWKLADQGGEVVLLSYFATF